MKVSYEGIGQLCATFGCDGAVTEGALVKVSASGKVKACAAGEAFCGVAAAVAKDGTTCSVQLDGFVTVKFSGAAPAVGYCALCADGSGGVKAGGDKSYLVAAVDGTNATIML